MICSDCTNPCWHICSFGLALCDNCYNFVYQDSARPLCEFCKIFYEVFEVIKE
ncbi:hypothetical protein LCGC14_0547940 [marine sediment metagenome]|uniref:Uncharacterized protein n=1 Tax=marine sediment metagenome TaxID=412755 RepID=A0A0F9S9F7_9ZZZZ